MGPWSGTWRRFAALGVLALWGTVSLARLTLVAADPNDRIGTDVEPFLDFARAVIPPDGAYLYLDPVEFAVDRGEGPRLRYELYPRRYWDTNALSSPDAVRQLMERQGRNYIVVPAARTYYAYHWVHSPLPWTRRIELPGQGFILVSQPEP